MDGDTRREIRPGRELTDCGAAGSSETVAHSSGLRAKCFLPSPWRREEWGQTCTIDNLATRAFSRTCILGRCGVSCQNRRMPCAAAEWPRPGKRRTTSTSRHPRCRVATARSPLRPQSPCLSTPLYTRHELNRWLRKVAIRRDTNSIPGFSHPITRTRR